MLKIKERIDTIERERMLLEDFVGQSYDDFISGDSVHEYYGALHHLQVALQAVLDIGHVIASLELLGPFKENKAVFAALVGKRILTAELGKNLTEATGVRNVLVHQYESVDSMRIYEIIQNDLGDFDKFVAETSAWLSKQNGGTA